MRKYRPDERDRERQTQSVFTWLGYEKDWDQMFCKVGRKQNVFQTGSTNFKKYSVQKHQESENLQLATAKKAGEAEPGTPKAEKNDLKNQPTNSA